MTMPSPLVSMSALIALGVLAGCETRITVAPPPPGLDADMPVAAPVALARVPQLNDFGGEVPRVAPAGDVGEDALAEAAPDQD